MAVKVAINGLSRIGRLAFWRMLKAEEYEVVAINDLTSPKILAHLLKYDSSQGTYALADKVEAAENSITVDGKEITVYAEADAKNLPWGELGIDMVLECTGFYTLKEKVSAHIEAGARKNLEKGLLTGFFFLYKKKTHLQRKKCANTIQITKWAAYPSSQVLQTKCVGSLSDFWNLIHLYLFHYLIL